MLSQRRKVFVEAMGNVVEWYDYMLYVYLIDTFGELFFPAGDQKTSFFILWVIFGLSCIMRPLGSGFFGRLADRVCKYRAQKLSIFLMGVSSLSLAVLPGYDKIGWFAVIMLLLIRCLQVGAASAQFTLSIFSLSLNHGEEPKAKNMLVPQLYSMIGVILAGFVMLFHHAWLGIPEEYYWRFAYALNIVFLTAYYFLIRDRAEVGGRERAVKPKPEKKAKLSSQWGKILLLAFFIVCSFSFVYICVILYLPTYLATITHHTEKFASKIILYSHIFIALALMVYVKLYRALSRFTKNGIIYFSLIALSAFLLLVENSLTNLMIVFAVASLLYAPYSFAIMRSMLLIFPKQLRFQCGGVAYNLGAAISSCLPAILTCVVNRYGMQGFSVMFLTFSILCIPAYYFVLQKIRAAKQVSMA